MSAVVMGVIDDGLAFAQARFRKALAVLARRILVAAGGPGGEAARLDSHRRLRALAR